MQREKWYWVVNATLFVAVFFIATSSLFSFFSENQKVEASPKQRGSKILLSFDEIGYGPLALNGVRTKNPVPNLARELVVLGTNSRPDVQPGEVALLLGLKTTQQEQVAFSGQTLFLKRQPKDVFLFSTDKTPLSITPIAMKDGSVAIEVVLEGAKGQFVLKNRPQQMREEVPFVKAIKEAKWWGPDLFLQSYGGEEYGAFHGKHKIEFSNSICFVQEGDFLMWEDAQWKSVSFDHLMPFFPIAKVSSISSKGVQIEAWDETGFYPMNMQISSPQTPRVNYKLDELISSIRPRTASELSCMLGKRRVVLREGDWWLKTESGWRHLKKLSDIEDYLAHKMRGDLFIFETVSMEKGKAEVKGHVFDAMRTQMQPIALTVMGSDKKNTAIARKASRGAPPPPFIAKTEERQRRLQVSQYQATELEEKKGP